MRDIDSLYRELILPLAILVDVQEKKYKEFSWLFSEQNHFTIWIKPVVFSSSHVQMGELDYKEGWALKNWWFWTAVLERTLESPSDCKEIKPVSPKGNQPWIFIGRTDAEAEALILRSPDAKSRLIGKDIGAGEDRKFSFSLWKSRGTLCNNQVPTVSQEQRGE